MHCDWYSIAAVLSLKKWKMQIPKYWGFNLSCCFQNVEMLQKVFWTGLLRGVVILHTED